MCSGTSSWGRATVRRRKSGKSRTTRSGLSLSVCRPPPAQAVRRAGLHPPVMDDLEAYEERFRRAGLPLLIEGWSAREDALPRAFPLLAIVLCGELLGALIVAFGLL